MPLARMETRWPTGLTQRPDYRRSFRNTVGGRARRRLNAAAEALSSASSYPPAKGSFSVHQRSGTATFDVALTSSAPAEAYVAFYKGRMPPYGVASRLARWAATHGLRAFPVARILARYGAVDAPRVQAILRDLRADIRRIEREAVAAWARSWGTLDEGG